MNNTLTPPFIRAALLFALISVPVCIHASSSKTEDLTDRKIRLMAEALQAKDRADYGTAKSKLEALLAFSPSDAQVNRLLQAVELAMKAREKAALESVKPVEDAMPSIGSGAPVENQPHTVQNQVVAKALIVEEPPVASPAVVANKIEEPIDADTLAARETSRQQDLIATSRAKLTHGLRLANEERFPEALKDFVEADQLLPRNLLTEPLRLEIEAARNDTEHRQRLSGFYQGASAPRLTISNLPTEGSVTAPAGEVISAPLVLDAYILELSPDIYADLLAAWAQICREQRITAMGKPVMLDRNGKQIFLRRAAPLPTGRQLTLYWSLLGATLKSGSMISIASPEGIVGVSGSIDSTSLVKSLSQMENCRVLAAPRVVIHPGYKTYLTLANDGAPVTPNTRLGHLDSSPRTGVELGISAAPASPLADTEFIINPSIIQYEGRAMTSALSPMFSRHESSTRVTLTQGTSAILGGLVREDGRAIAGRETPVQRFPLVGRILRERAAAERLRELVVIVTRR